MTDAFNVNLGGAKGNPVYEYIKKQDIEAAFRDALNLALSGVLQQIQELVDLYAASAPTSLWTWDFTSRWDYDFWG